LAQVDVAAMNGTLMSAVARRVVLGEVRNDRCVTFLDAIGVRCCRVAESQGAALVVLIRSNDEALSAAWALANYPADGERLVVVTSVAMDRSLVTLWRRKFADVQIVSAVEGRLGVATSGQTSLVFRSET